MMKTPIKKLLAVTVAMSMCQVTAASAAPVSIYEKGSTQAQSTQEEVKKPVIEYVPTNDQGIFLTVTETRKNANAPKEVFYTGEKVISLGIKTQLVTAEAKSSDERLYVRAGENKLTMKADGMKQGESATVTLTFKKSGLPNVTQSFKATMTDGTEKAPHLIANVDDLIKIQNGGLGLHYKQTGDISLEGVENWTPIGSQYAPFTGSYDGGNFTIKQTLFTPFFGTIAGDRTVIKNMKFTGDLDTKKDNPLMYEAQRKSLLNITNSGSDKEIFDPLIYCGTLAARLEKGTVEGCSFNGTIKSDRALHSVSGLIASVGAQGTVKNCSVKATVKINNSLYYAAGIAADLSGYMTNCSTNLDVLIEGNAYLFGGLVGINNGTIENSVTTGKIEKYGSKAKIGGICADNKASVTGSAFNGTLYVRGDDNFVGGITAKNYKTVINCYTKGSVTTDGYNIYSGGIAGINDRAGVSLCGNEAVMNHKGDEGRIGGIVGENLLIIDNNTSYGVDSLKTMVNSCYMLGDISSEGSGTITGGIAGSNIGEMDITLKKKNFAQCIIENCYVKSEKIDGKKAGRIAGELKISTLGEFGKDVLSVTMNNNTAFVNMKLNGALVYEQASLSGINGYSATEAELKTFADSYAKMPEGKKLVP